MKPFYFFWILLFFISVSNSSFYCYTATRSVPADSAHYFKPEKIILSPNDFKDNGFQLMLHDGLYIFFKDTAGSNLFKASRDGNNFYFIISAEPTSVNDTAIITTIKYQAFDKLKQTSSSKLFALKDLPIPLSRLRSVTVYAKDYDKFISKKK